MSEDHEDPSLYSEHLHHPLQLIVPATLRSARLIRPMLDALADHVNLGFYAHDDLGVASEAAFHVMREFGNPDSRIIIYIWPHRSADIMLRMETPVRLGVTQQLLDEYHGSAVIRSLIHATHLYVDGERLIAELHVGRHRPEGES